MKKVKRVWVVLNPDGTLAGVRQTRRQARAYAFAGVNRVLPGVVTWTEPKPKREKRA